MGTRIKLFLQHIAPSIFIRDDQRYIGYIFSFISVIKARPLQIVKLEIKRGIVTLLQLEVFLLKKEEDQNMLECVCTLTVCFFF